MTVRLLKIGTTIATICLSISIRDASAESKARIVRLSDVEGTVQIERSAGEGFEKAFLNLPVVEGSRVKTGKDGRAEIEFEDASAVRLGPNSELAFTQLALGDDGQKLNVLRLASGTFYANIREKKEDQFQLAFAQESITVPESAHFRLILNGADHATVAVLKGSVKVAAPSGEVQVAEKHTATVNLAVQPATINSNQKNGPIVVAKNYDDDPSDGWDRQQNDYHQRYASAANPDFSSPYGYGLSDLNYYGSFNLIPGYGYAWQPFFVDGSWNPFMDGAWAYYSGAGYLWVSAYPWGWMPYYYGAWGFAPGHGWYWQPGQWNTWSTFPGFLSAPARSKATLVPPASGHQIVMVGKGLTGYPAMVPTKLTINPGSASLGVPRGAVNHLAHYAKTMDRTSRPVSVSTVAPPLPPSAFWSNPDRSGMAPRMSPMTGASASHGMVGGGSHRN
jgi:FecR protein